MTAKRRLVCGVDEAGRGPLAGPVVVAAVILDPKAPIDGLNDSKKLTEKKRDRLFVEIREKALAFSVVSVSHETIDEINIFQATMRGMAQAVEGLPVVPTEVLIDGNSVPKDLRLHAKAIVGGDGIEPCIQAASILAKVTRDALMADLDARHPGYGFSKHKGYPTREHVAALERLGPCPEHRKSFGPVAKVLIKN